ncbi:MULTISPECIES: TRAP transporter substrate-binding protein DctP [unclassified Comamonas]|uniref:TRAP transporter substrate-binding protein DctP n=1 Tax=unclassified Comamonas TaxID=2638500 RepID=UPI000EB088FB|nr:TRAP transporter substrate-binding protein DctP [Comamonas sp. lk]
MDRRSLVKHVGMAGVLAAGMAPAVHAQDVLRWRLAASFPKMLDTVFGSAEKFAQTLKALSGGKFEVSVHPAGELMPAYGVVDGIQSDAIEMALTAPYYFTDKDACFALGCAVPFGFTARQMDAWMEHGGGRKLMDDFYAAYNIKSLSAGNTGTQMGGWFRKEIKTVADLKGLRMRVGGGLFGEALQKLGVQAFNMPINEAYQALEKGRLDAVEFVGPYDDQKLGFGKIAPYYYYPGWWEGGAELAFFINAKAYAGLTPEFKAMVEAAASVAARDMTGKYLALNPAALKKLLSERVQLRAFPRELMDAGFKTVMQSMAENETKSPSFKKIHRSLRSFQHDQLLWDRFSEFRYASYMSVVRL